MHLRLNPDLICRHEFYGGLIHSRLDGSRWEVTHADTTFLQTLEKTGDPGWAARITRSVYPGSNYIPDLFSMFAQGIVVNGPRPTASTKQLTREGIRDYHESLTRDYLRAPLNMSLYPFMVCQLECTFCFVTEEKWNARGWVGADKWIRLMTQAREAGVPFISFLGGDPSLYPEIGRLIRACDEVGIKGTITSNGLKMRDDLFAALIETEMITPTFSIQSLDGLHLALTGRSVDGTLETIRRVRQAGKDCNVNLVYTEQNVEQVLRVADFCADLGVTKLSIGVFINITGAPVHVPTFTDYRRLYEYVLNYIDQQGYELDFQVEGCQLYTAYPELPTTVDTAYEQLTLGCEAGNGRAEIMHDGTLLPCALLNKDRWGDVNVFTQGFQAAWDNGVALKKIRTYKTADTACNSCSFGGFCNGGCPAMNEKLHGTIYGEGDTRCEIRDKIKGSQPVPKHKLLPLMVLR